MSEPRSKRPNVGGAPPPEGDRTRTDARSRLDEPASGQTARVYLMVHAADGVDLRPLEAGEEIVVGRGADAEVRVEEDRVSRRNTSIRNAGGAVVVRDLGSRNGTRVDGEVLRGAEARPGVGAAIVVGAVRITVAGMGRAVRGARATGAESDAPPVAVDARTRQVFDRIAQLARMPTHLLLVGETGVGKEVLVERLHAESPRAKGPLVRVNCAALPSALIEAELFGYEQGAFTGASQRRSGLLEAASGGTLFLDEVGELDVALQAKLLRVIESHRVVRIGGRDEVAVDARIVSATNRDLTQAMAEGRFRSDLYYRLAGFVLEVPPLRERKDDVRPLATRFLSQLATRAGLPVPDIGEEALAALEQHTWPGNIRELRNAIEHVLIVCEGDPIRVDHLPPTVGRSTAASTAVAVSTAVAASTAVGGATSAPAMRARVADLERESILAALAASGGHQGRAAEALGISRRAFVYKLGKYGLR